MKRNGIISIILKNKNVNFYTKLLIFLYYKNQNSDYLITNEVICKYLKLDNNVYNKKRISLTLKQLELDKIIKIKIKMRRRHFKWLINEENYEKMFENKNIFIPDYDWLNDTLF